MLTRRPIGVIKRAGLGGYCIKGRPRKNRELLVGRAGRNAIEHEDIARDARRWERRKQTLKKFKEIL